MSFILAAVFGCFAYAHPVQHQIHHSPHHHYEQVIMYRYVNGVRLHWIHGHYNDRGHWVQGHWSRSIAINRRHHP